MKTFKCGILYWTVISWMAQSFFVTLHSLVLGCFQEKLLCETLINSIFILICQEKCNECNLVITQLESCYAVSKKDQTSEALASDSVGQTARGWLAGLVFENLPFHTLCAGHSLAAQSRTLFWGLPCPGSLKSRTKCRRVHREAPVMYVGEAGGRETNKALRSVREISHAWPDVMVFFGRTARNSQGRS